MRPKESETREIYAVIKFAGTELLWTDAQTRMNIIFE